MNRTSETRTALELVAALRAELDAARFPFPAPSSLAAEERRVAALAELDGVVIPQLRQVGDPVVIGLAGGTGVGKSALANSLAGKALSPVGALRPTTRTPRLLASPATAAMLGDHPALRAAELVLDQDAAQGWAVLDCGDPFVSGNDPVAAQPDVPVSAWLVVTSALRYGDALLWDLLQGVGRDGVPVALVVNRTPPDAWEKIRPDVGRRLEALALGYVAQFAVDELAGAPEVLPPDGIGQVREWLTHRFPPPAAEPPLDPRPLLDGLAKTAAELAADQRLHAETVALLRRVTETTRAGLTQAVPMEPDAVAADAWARVAGAWRGTAAPAGSLELLKTAGLDRRWDGASDAVSEALEPFEQALTSVEVDAPRAVPWLADRLAQGVVA